MQQLVEKSPFLKMDKQMVLGFLKGTGSRAPMSCTPRSSS